MLNENEATSYPVAPNNTVTLWDKNLPKIYIKSVNGQGVPSMRKLEYIECNENAEKQPAEGFNGKANNQPTLDGINALNGKFDNILSEFSTLKDKINDLSAKPAPVLTKTVKIGGIIMPNSIFNSYGNNMIPNPYANIINQAMELRKTLQGNPRDIVQNLLNSGQMSQQTFNQLHNRHNR